jgi:5'-nucleotidase/UDP-sugar diphosphatase
LRSLQLIDVEKAKNRNVYFIAAEHLFSINPIADYFDNPNFSKNISSSISQLTTRSTGCFYTDALQKIFGSDIVIQNFRDIRDVIYEGTITPFSIYSIDPFGNGFNIFSMTVTQLKNFLNGYSSSFSYSLDTSLLHKRMVIMKLCF